MLKYIIPVVLLMGFTGCDLNEEELLKSIVGDAEEVPEGTYISQCVINDSLPNSKFTLILSADSYTLQEDTFSDVDCLVSDSVGSPSAAVAVDLPGADLGDGFSFFTNADDKKVPYFYKDGQFVLGEPQDSLPSGEDDFSGFEADFEAGRIAIYQAQ